MPIGVLTNSCAIALGGLLGALLGKRIPASIRTTLPSVFGLIAGALGIVLIVTVKYLPAVALALILGTVAGELLRIDDAVSGLAAKLQGWVVKGKTGGDPEATRAFISVFVLFCFSANGIFGSLSEGISGDSSILMLKSILDFFTAAIFAASAGYIILFIAIPQLVFFLLLFASASLLMPVVSPTMMSDFKACGGIIVVAIALRMLHLKEIKVMNLLPALALVMPFSWLWGLLTGAV